MVFRRATAPIIALLVATPGCTGRAPAEPEPEVGIGACDTDLEPEFVGASRVVQVDPRNAPLAWDLGLVKGQIALTFDGGPSPDTTRSILETLAAQNVKATFFVVGQNVDAAPEIVREIAAAGHTLGSHGYSHLDLTELTLDEALDEVRRGRQALVNATSTVVPPALFRFPMFASTAELEDAVVARAMTPVFANVITEDWLIPDPTELLEHSLDALEEAGGGVILFHDIHPQTALMLDAFLEEILARGYETVVLRPAPTLASLGARSDLRMGTALFTHRPALR
jgi:peptidoglycan/xylan/chitin deacetylase (PgdA/CDA1 family)